jgi:hypothetical protein
MIPGWIREMLQGWVMSQARLFYQRSGSLSTGLALRPAFPVPAEKLPFGNQLGRMQDNLQVSDQEAEGGAKPRPAPTPRNRGHLHRSWENDSPLQSEPIQIMLRELLLPSTSP